MVKNANKLVEDLVSVFLEANMEHLNILMTSTQNVINENNMEIMKFLKDHDVDEKILEKLAIMLEL